MTPQERLAWACLTDINNQRLIGHSEAFARAVKCLEAYEEEEVSNAENVIYVAGKSATKTAAQAACQAAKTGLPAVDLALDIAITAIIAL